MLAQLSTAEIDSKSIFGAWLFDRTNGKVAEDSFGDDNDSNLVAVQNG